MAVEKICVLKEPEETKKRRSELPPPSETKKLKESKDEQPQPDTSSALDLKTPFEWLSLAGGVLILLVCGLPVGLLVFTVMLWEAMDRRFDGGFVNSGKELTGPLFSKVLPAITQFTQKFNEQFLKKPEDAYMMNVGAVCGVLVPLMFSACAYHVYSTGAVSLWLLFGYHVLRIGPFFQNFAYVYTLCHKEGHSRAGLFKQPYNSSMVMRNWFNWWVGMFYGVLPATFAYGHSINHHKYNNGPMDIISTSDKPRDSFVNWVAYLPRYFAYAVNITTLHQFVFERNWKVVTMVIAGNVWFGSWVCLWAWLLGPFFAVTYVLFPTAEAGLLLAAVNWSWHSFIDPSDPNNEFVQSITILDGRVNVLNEDSHVVHHQYPGGHWTDHPQYMNKHWADYAEHSASVFRTTHAFEIFGMAVARDYDELAKKFVDLKGERDGKPLSHQERVEVMKSRLRACWWGPRVDAATTAKTGNGEKSKVK